jgi:hypothetical protein
VNVQTSYRLIPARGSHVLLYAFLTSALDRGEWSASGTGRFNPRKSALDVSDNRIMSCPCWESNPDSPITKHIVRSYVETFTFITSSILLYNEYRLLFLSVNKDGQNVKLSKLCNSGINNALYLLPQSCKLSWSGAESQRLNIHSYLGLPSLYGLGCSAVDTSGPYIARII